MVWGRDCVCDTEGYDMGGCDTIRALCVIQEVCDMGI